VPPAVRAVSNAPTWLRFDVLMKARRISDGDQSRHAEKGSEISLVSSKRAHSFGTRV